MELEGREGREGKEGREVCNTVYVVPCDELTGLAMFDRVVLCTYTVHVVNLKGRMGKGGTLRTREWKCIHIKSFNICHTYFTLPSSPTRSTWTLTLVYSSP